MKQEIMRWQGHQLDHIQIIYTLLQTDNNASTLPLSFYHAMHYSCLNIDKFWGRNRWVGKSGMLEHKSGNISETC